jgi:type IV secretory pathway TrbD component
MSEPHPFHPSLSRPILFAGAEPAAAVLEVLTAGALLFGVGFHIASILLAVFYLTVVHGLMTWVAAQDPQMSQLYLRSLAAHDYYPAHAKVDARPVAVKLSIPRAG